MNIKEPKNNSQPIHKNSVSFHEIEPLKQSPFFEESPSKPEPISLRIPAKTKKSSREQKDLNDQIISQVKENLKVSVPMRTFILNIILILSVSLSLDRTRIFQLQSSINTQLHFSAQELKKNPIIDDLQFDTIGTMQNAWYKMKTMVNNLVLDPEGDLFSIKIGIECTEEWTNMNRKDPIFLSSFNQVLGFSLSIETFESTNSSSFFLPGLYCNEGNDYVRELEANVSVPDDVSMILITAAFYNDFLKTIGMMELEFNYQEVGELIGNLEFEAMKPYVFNESGEFDFTFWFCFIVSLLVMFNSTIDIIVCLVIFIKNLSIYLRTKVFSHPK